MVKKKSSPAIELPQSSLEMALLAHVNGEGYRPAKPFQIAKKLKLDSTQERELKTAIKQLIKQGRLRWGPKHLVVKAAERQSQPNEVTGTFRRASAGYGFVIPDGTVPGDRSNDVFIPPRKTRDAASGDRVVARVRRSPPGEKLRRNGEIVEVLSRKTNRFVGTYRERGGFGLVLVDGGAFDSAILVGDAGARDCRPGDKVVIEMVHFPSTTDEGEGVIVEVLGPRGKPGVDTQMIIHEFGLPGEFPESVMEEARKQSDIFAKEKEATANRVDFTAETVITIDPTKARDFDDAISLQQHSNGNWQLGVHIADVSHFVVRGSELDREAFARGNSVYLPDRVIPMLPEIISNNLASLQPQRRRFTMSMLIDLDERGTVLGSQWCRGVIKSAHRFCYEDIDAYLANPNAWREKLTPEVFRLVGDMHRLAMIMRKRRMGRGAIDLALPEIAIDLNENGRVSGAHVEPYTESHQVIEEFMLAANESVARKLVEHELFLLRRVHEPPSTSKLRDLTEFVRNLGFKVDSLQSRFELKRVVDLTRELPERHAVHFAVLRSMQKAVYSPRDSGHYALASEAYCHFTSPIRRYPDLVIHRMVGDILDQRRPQADFERLTQIGQHCSDTEQRAEQAERELIKLKLLSYLADRIGSTLVGTVTGVEAFGLFVQGVELPAEGLLHLENLPRDRYTFDAASRKLSGFRGENQFRLGDRIQVKVGSVDLDRRELEFEFLGAPPKSPKRMLRRQGNLPPGKKSKAHRVVAKNGQQGKGSPHRSAPWQSNRDSKRSGKHRGNQKRRNRR